MNKTKEINAINIQLIALLLTLFSAIVSILITYNQKLNLEEKETIFTAKEQYNITLFNRILILSLALIFLYVNYTLYKISKDENENLKSYKLQIVASILVIISEIIVLYVVKLSETENIVDVENPVI